MEEQITIVKSDGESIRTFRAGSGFRMPEIPGTSLIPERFTSTYYDTADYRLARHHIALCRRVEGRDARWELALYGHPSQPLVRCAERSLHPPAGFRDALYIFLHEHALTPVTKLRTRRTSTHVLDGDRPLAKVMCDTVRQLSGRRIVHRYFQIIVESIDAEGSALSRIEGILRAAGAMDGDERSAIFQAIGFDVPAQQPAISPTAPTIDHLNAKFATEVKAILAHDPGTRLGLDPEDLHQMRVSTRRLRATLRAAAPLLSTEWAEHLRTELSWLGDLLGRVRDLDVLHQNLRLESATLDPPEQRAFKRLVASLDGEHHEARAAMLQALRSDRYAQLLDRLRSAVEAPECVVSNLSLGHLAAREFKKLRKAVQALGLEPTDSDLHQVRIKVRRARYAAELAAVILGRPAMRFIEQAKLLQQIFGEHQDAVVAEERLRRLISHTRGKQAIFAAGLVVERQRARRRAARAAFEDLWNKLEKRGRKAWS